MPVIDDFMRAIARKEGYYAGDTLAKRNNNPGNLRSWGGVPVVNGFAKFATIDSGWSALRKQIWNNIRRNLTLYEFFAGTYGLHPTPPYIKDPYGPVDRRGTTPSAYYGYAPAKDRNDPIGYTNFVAPLVGIDPNVPLSLYQWIDDNTARGADGGINGGSVPINNTTVNDPSLNSGIDPTSGNQVRGWEAELERLWQTVNADTVTVPGVGAVGVGVLGLAGMGLLVLAGSRKRR